MESSVLESVLDSPEIKLVDSCIALRSERINATNCLLRHLYDCKNSRDIFPEVLEDTLDSLNFSFFFFNFPNVYFTNGVIREVNYVFECVQKSLKFFNFTKRGINTKNIFKMKASARNWAKNEDSWTEKEDLLLEVHNNLYKIVRNMKQRKIFFDNSGKEQVSYIRDYLVELAKKHSLKYNSSLKYDEPKSKKVGNSSVDEEIVATALVLSMQGKIPVKILTADYDIERIAGYICRNYNRFDSSLFKELKKDILVYRQNNFSNEFLKVESIPKFTGERFGLGILERIK